MKKRLFTLITMLLIGVYAAFAQQTITVNGTVVSEDNGEPVIGASILVLGTTKGTITDIDGHFTLNEIAANAQLKVSYVGMLTQTVKAAHKLTIILKSDTQVIDEVVVTDFRIIVSLWAALTVCVNIPTYETFSWALAAISFNVK